MFRFRGLDTKLTGIEPARVVAGILAPPAATGCASACRARPVRATGRCAPSRRRPRCLAVGANALQWLFSNGLAAKVP